MCQDINICGWRGTWTCDYIFPIDQYKSCHSNILYQTKWVKLTSVQKKGLSWRQYSFMVFEWETRGRCEVGLNLILISDVNFGRWWPRPLLNRANRGGSDATQAKLNSTHTSALPVRPHFPQDISKDRNWYFFWKHQLLWDWLACKRPSISLLFSMSSKH